MRTERWQITSSFDRFLKLWYKFVSKLQQQQQLCMQQMWCLGLFNHMSHQAKQSSNQQQITALHSDLNGVSALKYQDVICEKYRPTGKAKQ